MDEDWKTLYEHLSKETKSKEYDWFKTMLWILMNTGMRMGEARILKWNQGKSDHGRKMAKNYVYLSPDCSKITSYYKRPLRTIPVEHIKEIFNKIPKSKIVYKGKSREQKVEFVYVFENPISRTPHDHPNMIRMFKSLMTDLKLNEQYAHHTPKNLEKTISKITQV